VVRSHELDSVRELNMGSGWVGKLAVLGSGGRMEDGIILEGKITVFRMNSTLSQ